MPNKSSRRKGGIEINDGSYKVEGDLVAGDKIINNPPPALPPKPKGPSSNFYVILAAIITATATILAVLLNQWNTQAILPAAPPVTTVSQQSTTRTPDPGLIQISGHVSAVDTRANIPDANLSFNYLGSTVAVFSDDLGNFTFQVSPPQTQQFTILHVQKPGFGPYTQNLTIPPVNANLLDIRLTPDALSGLKATAIPLPSQTSRQSPSTSSPPSTATRTPASSRKIYTYPPLPPSSNCRLPVGKTEWELIAYYTLSPTVTRHASDFDFTLSITNCRDRKFTFFYNVRATVSVFDDQGTIYHPILDPFKQGCNGVDRIVDVEPGTTLTLTYSDSHQVPTYCFGSFRGPINPNATILYVEIEVNSDSGLLHWDYDLAHESTYVQ